MIINRNKSILIIANHLEKKLFLNNYLPYQTMNHPNSQSFVLVFWGQHHVDFQLFDCF